MVAALRCVDLVLVFEDLHWADPSSRDVLRYLVARMRHEHVLVVGSYRTDDLHRTHPLRPLLGELWRHPRVERLDVAPFTAAELRAFAAAVHGSPLSEAALTSVLERSEGNAYFAEELIEAGTGSAPGGGAALPWSLGEVLRSRLERVDAGVQQLTRIASVAGRTVAEPLLRAVAEQHCAGHEVDAVLVDNLVDGSWPKFLHPHPLSDKYFLVSCKPTPASRWGIYLVDVFDGMKLRFGNRLAGPCVIEQVNTSTFVTPEFKVIVDRLGTYTLYVPEREEEVLGRVLG